MCCLVQILEPEEFHGSSYSLSSPSNKRPSYLQLVPSDAIRARQLFVLVLLELASDVENTLLITSSRHYQDDL